MSVSVVMIVRNGSRFLDGAIDSVVAQTQAAARPHTSIDTAGTRRALGIARDSVRSTRADRASRSD